jgi:hypothetical protein
VKNEGNEHTVADPRRMISMSNELIEDHKEMFKKDIIKELTEILLVELQEKLKGNIQNQLKEY